MYITRLKKVGGSVMLAVPPAVLKTLALSADSEVGMTIDNGRLVIEPQKRPRYSLEELLAQCDPHAEMSEEDIQEAIAGFALAARHAREAGFDGVELHGANGYLLHEFMSAEFNQRSDQWGGTFLERLRMPLAVIAAVRAAVGEEFVVGMRLSQSMVCDGRLKWEGGEEQARQRFRILADAGLDYLHITEPDAREPAFGEGPSLAAIAKGSVAIPVIGNGAIVTGEQAEALLGRGEMDLVAVGKAALANNDWPQRIQQGIELSDFDGSMFVPMATITNELAWRNANDRPALRSS